MSSSGGQQFALAQLEKYGWKEGKGLGREESGITEALKPKLKFNSSGLGHDLAEEFKFHWWDHMYNKIADNLGVEKDQDGAVQLTTKKDDVQISKKIAKSTKAKFYGGFVKGGLLVGQEEEKEESSDEEQERDMSHKLSDEELFRFCGGRTAHKGARHGLTMAGKLARVKEQENKLMQKWTGGGKTDDKPQDQKNKIKNFEKGEKNSSLKNGKWVDGEDEGLKAAGTDFSDSFLASKSVKKKKKKCERKDEDSSMSEDAGVAKEATGADLDESRLLNNSVKKKKKKKRNREEGDEDGLIENGELITGADEPMGAAPTDLDSAVLVDTSGKKKKKKRNRERDEEDGLIENGELITGADEPMGAALTDLDSAVLVDNSAKKKKKKRNRERGEEDDLIENGVLITGADEPMGAALTDLSSAVLVDNSAKKKKKKRKHSADVDRNDTLDCTVDVTVSGDENKKKKKRKLETIEDSILRVPNVSQEDEEVVIKRKKKKKKVQEEEELVNMTEESEVVKKKKSKKRKHGDLCKLKENEVTEQLEEKVNDEEMKISKKKSKRQNIKEDIAEPATNTGSKKKKNKNKEKSSTEF